MTKHLGFSAWDLGFEAERLWDLEFSSLREINLHPKSYNYSRYTLLRSGIPRGLSS